MKIFVEDIPKDGLKIEKNIDISPESLVEESIFNESVSVNIKIKQKGMDKYIVRGKVKTSLDLVCSRCLSLYTEKINSSFDLILYSEEKRVNSEEIKLDEKDLETIYFNDGIINIERIIIDNINLSLPQKPLCSKECKGLCPVCGKNLNTGDCGCEVDKKDPRIKLIINKMRGI